MVAHFPSQPESLRSLTTWLNPFNIGILRTENARLRPGRQSKTDALQEFVIDSELNADRNLECLTSSIRASSLPFVDFFTIFCLPVEG